MNRHSYMFLYHRWDAEVARAYRHYAAKARSVSPLPGIARELLQELEEEGHLARASALQ